MSMNDSPTLLIREHGLDPQDPLVTMARAAAESILDDLAREGVLVPNRGQAIARWTASIFLHLPTYLRR